MIYLSDLTPEGVADEIWDWFQGHIGKLLMFPPMGDEVLGHARMHVRHSVACLTAYAQRGVELDAPPAEYLQSVAEILWTAVHPDVYSGTDTIGESRGEAEHAIDVVIRAALARDRLASVARGRVPLVWLAALAGVSYQRMRAIASSGELPAENAEARCADARRWLEARGVPGIGRRA